jgi:tetratricopeptide (TPR) repeat protein/tRNA A-37 threonylcarbamoyl transferase component Bud32
MLVMSQHSVDAGAASERWEPLLKLFDRAWLCGPRPVIEDYLPADRAGRRTALMELVHEDLEHRLRAGEMARAEEYIERYPELKGDGSFLVNLLATEWRIRRRREPGLALEEYLERFPQHCQELTFSLTPGLAEARAPAAGTRLGRYMLLEVVGRGAFGVVYRARDTDLDRIVAVKVPRAGRFASRDDEDRFLREARSAAQLKHPNIVTIHDAGRLDEQGGACYLVSEFVHGTTLAERLATSEIDFRAAAGLIAAVAKALDYAHRQGVIHRDIKPANIILDQAGEPHVMDFGLAKREAGEITLTHDGEVLGTPAYMAPEQARGEAHRFDARSDVYSLGVVLYELVTGELPFRGNARMVLAQVVEEEPRPPRRLNEAVPRDLETICLRAMAKKPVERYSSAGELAEDLCRWRCGEPIRARPVGPLERGWRWCRRKPLIAALAAALALVFTGGFAGVFWEWRRAEKQAGAARRSADEANQQRRLAAASLQTAEANFHRARQAVDTFFTVAVDNNLFNQPSYSPIHEKLLKAALSYYQDFVRERTNDPALRIPLAQAYFRAGVLTDAIGDKSEALTALQRAESLYQALALKAPSDRDLRESLWRCQLQMGVTLRALGRHEQALCAFEQARQVVTQLWHDVPLDVTMRISLSAIMGNAAIEHDSLGQTAEADSLYEGVKDIQEQLLHDDPQDARYRVQLARTFNNLAIRCGDRRKGIQYHERALALREELLRSSPDSPLHRRDLARTCALLANVLQDMGMHSEALHRSQQAIPYLEQCVNMEPAVTQYRQELAETWYWRAKLLRTSGRPIEAIRAFEESCSIYEGLVKVSCKEKQHLQSLVESCQQLGSLNEGLGRYAGALVPLQRKAKVLELLIHGFASEESQKDLAETKDQIARLRGKLKQSSS